LANSKPIQYSAYVIVLVLIIAAKFYSNSGISPKKKMADEFPKEQVEIIPSIVTTVDHVTTGNTLIAGGIHYRLAFMDAPEHDQAYGLEATEFLRGLVGDAVITITELGKDPSGRAIADIHRNGIRIAEMMIENGYAWPYRVPTEDMEKRLFQLKEKARVARAGLWADPNPPSSPILGQTDHAANHP